MYVKSKNLQKISYKPDFVGNNWIIETKGLMSDSFPLRWKLFKKYLMNNNMQYDLFMPKNHAQIDSCIQMIKEKMK